MLGMKPLIIEVQVFVLWHRPDDFECYDAGDLVHASGGGYIQEPQPVDERHQSLTGSGKLYFNLYEESPRRFNIGMPDPLRSGRRQPEEVKRPVAPEGLYILRTCQSFFLYLFDKSTISMKAVWVLRTI